MTQSGVVARLALRELWISFRLFAVLAVFVAAGAFVALVPATLPTTMERMSLGLGAAILVAAGVAASAIAAERVTGRAGWLITRSVSRSVIVGGWFLAIGGVALVGTLAAGLLGWLAAASVSATLSPAAYLSLLVAAGATSLAAAALGLAFGVVLPAPAAVGGSVALGLALGWVAWVVPGDPSLLPGGAIAALATLHQSDAPVTPGLRNAGLHLALAALLLVAARAALHRVEL